MDLFRRCMEPVEKVLRVRSSENPTLYPHGITIFAWSPWRRCSGCAPLRFLCTAPFCHLLTGTSQALHCSLAYEV